MNVCIGRADDKPSGAGSETKTHRYKVRLTKLLNRWEEADAECPADAERVAYDRALAAGGLEAGSGGWSDDDDIQVEDDTIILDKERARWVSVKDVFTSDGGEKMYSLPIESKK